MKTKTGKYLRCSLCLFLLMACHSSRREFKVVDLIMNLDWPMAEGYANLKQDFKVKIVSYHRMTAYIVPNVRHPREFILDQKTGEVTIKTLKSDTVHTYHIIIDNNKHGLKFDSLNAVNSKIFDIDSLYETINIGKLNRETFALNGKNLLFSSRDAKTGKILIEKYDQAKPDYADTIFRYYDYAMRDIEFSISPILDKRSGSKLVGLRIIENPKFDGKEHSTRGETMYTLKRGTLDNSEQLMKLFEIVKKESERLRLN